MAVEQTHFSLRVFMQEYSCLDIKYVILLILTGFVRFAQYCTDFLENV